MDEKEGFGKVVTTDSSALPRSRTTIYEPDENGVKEIIKASKRTIDDAEQILRRTDIATGVTRTPDGEIEIENGSANESECDTAVNDLDAAQIPRGTTETEGVSNAGLDLRRLSENDSNCLLYTSPSPRDS